MKKTVDARCCMVAVGEGVDGWIGWPAGRLAGCEEVQTKME